MVKFATFSPSGGKLVPMRLPRRVPWVSSAELDQVCSWIYTDAHDLDAKGLAVNRIAAWKAITSVPHAIDSTHSLLVVILQDEQASSRLALRQSYAAAIIRMVNGLVDPLQFGLYARSIASIATQLGLPLWLVELRHAATHEELPSLELLREGASQAMAWLLQNYWIPTLNPSTALVQAKPLRPLLPILKQYKTLMKTITRDASLKNHYMPSIQALYRDVGRWISEARVGTNLAAGESGRESGMDDVKEKWALERLCDALLEKGVLVPLSKKKRVGQEDVFLPSSSSIALWEPLLQHLSSVQPDFPDILASRIISHITLDSDSASMELTMETGDNTFEQCLARWAYHIVQSCEAEESDTSVRQEAIASLILALGPILPSTQNAATALLTALTSDDVTTKDLLSTVFSSGSISTPQAQWDESAIGVMRARMMALTEKDEAMDDTPTAGSTIVVTSAGGWRLLDSTSWTPSAIGVYVL